VRHHLLKALAEWLEIFQEMARQAGKEYAEIGVDYEQSEEQGRAAIQRLARAERQRGCTLWGPHRDDLRWSRRGRELPGHASSGEIHRILALAKLAEWRAVEKATGERPLLAIDEFDAGLAAGWVDALLEALPEAETILLTTATEPARYRRRVDQVLEVRAGSAFAPPRAVNA
jgi:DNA replication and repair protein RecF